MKILSFPKNNTKKPDPDEEVPAETRPTRGLQQKVFGARAAAAGLKSHKSPKSLKSKERPKSPDAKVSISLRLPQETLDRWKASGHGWQTRMANLLKDSI